MTRFGYPVLNNYAEPVAWVLLGSYLLIANVLLLNLLIAVFGFVFYSSIILVIVKGPKHFKNVYRASVSAWYFTFLGILWLFCAIRLPNLLLLGLAIVSEGD